jgi:hypothetical protein
MRSGSPSCWWPGWRRLLVVGTALVLPALVGKWMNHWRPDLVPVWMSLVPALLFVLLLFGQILRYILRATRVNSEVLCAAVAGYLLLGFLWALAYILTARLSADAFTFSAGPAAGDVMKGFTALYFSFITLCTVGYGDIMPVTGPARMLAMMEGVTGMFYMAVLIARLVAIHSSTQAARRAESTDDG